MDEHRSLSVTPDRYLTYRYAGASGDFNPIHLDDEFARSVGLPGRILHGLWTMAQVARAEGELAGDPLALKSLSVQFRGLGVPENSASVVISSPATTGACQVNSWPPCTMRAKSMPTSGSSTSGKTARPA